MTAVLTGVASIESANLQHGTGEFDLTSSKLQTQVNVRYANVLGVNISAVNMEDAVSLAGQWIVKGKPGYACVSSVHGVMEAQCDPQYREILNRAAFNLPDGMPLTWVGRIQGHHAMDRVFGPEFMLEMCKLSVERGYRNFLYGGRPGVAEELRESLLQRLPGLEIVGTYTPPFRVLNPEEEKALKAQIHDCRPHILWVGISTPKQERFMARHVEQLQVPLLVGVGAAFDFDTGRIRDCSKFTKRVGLQWLHRLSQDPKHLWRRYARNNPAFVWHTLLQLGRLRNYSDGYGSGHELPLKVPGDESKCGN